MGDSFKVPPLMARCGEFTEVAARGVEKLDAMIPGVSNGDE